VRALGGLLLAAAAAAAPPRELLREESFNYRVVGALPAGWEQSKADLPSYEFSIDGIPHAYVRLVRERVAGDVDVEAQLRKRAPHYRFPSAPADAPWTVTPVEWADGKAFLFEHEATVGGVLCRRRVRALFAKSVWYELTETVFGAETEKEDACARGLDVFRHGFRLLTRPVDAAALADAGAATVRSEEFGFEIAKPEGFRRLEVDTATDPGCRVAFERVLPAGRHVLVRLFEYGAREKLDPEPWIAIFFNGFVGAHREAHREPEEAPPVPGARKVWAERFTGEREGGAAVTTRLYLVHAEDGRVFALHVRSTGAEEDASREALANVLAGFRVER
jgi:hypothetical protein